jgi:hypothetical protein
MKPKKNKTVAPNKKGAFPLQLNIPKELFQQIEEFKSKRLEAIDPNSSKFTKEELERIVQHTRKSSVSEGKLMVNTIHREKIAGCYMGNRITRVGTILQLIATGLSVSSPNPEMFSYKQVLEAVEAVNQNVVSAAR